MKSYKKELSFIKREDIVQHVKKVIETVKKRYEDTNEKLLDKNVLDPFSAIFDSRIQNITMEVWLKQEKARQNQKTLQNALGSFHQNIIGSIVECESLPTGSVIDIKNKKKRIIAEIKNKHNTTKGNHKTAIYDDLKELLDTKFKGYTAYYVEVIPKGKKFYDKPFTPSDNRSHARRPLDNKIRIIDGKSFYSLLTGDPDALEKIYFVLPEIIDEVLGRKYSDLVHDGSHKNLFNRIY